MSEEITSDPIYPPAPETHADIVPAKKRAVKKAATKKAAVKKVAAKKVTAKKATKTKVTIEVTPVAAVVEVPVEVATEPAAKAKRITKKKAKVAEQVVAPEVAPQPPAPAPVVEPISEPVVITTFVEPPPIPPLLPEVAPVSSAPAATVEATPAPGAEAPAGPGEELGGGRRLRWWERRKLERQARAAARAAAGGGGQQGGQQAAGQGGQSGGGQQGNQGRQGGGRENRDGGREGREGRHGGEGREARQDQPRHGGHGAESEFDERSSSVPLGPPEPAEGILELSMKGHGFLRLKDKGWAQLPSDVFVHAEVIRKGCLRDGMFVKGQAQKGSRGLQLTEVSEANGKKPEELRDLPIFEELKAVNPAKRYQLETRQDRLTTRVVDMMTPVGRGQRGLIVSPPRAGKTTILQHIAEAITHNYPHVHLMILLVDERPEEVTEFKRSLPNAELFASSNDQDAKSHARIAELAINRAKRLVEQGDHVFMLMDSITRLARAFNNLNKGGATMSGGMGVGSMEVPRRLFAAARNTRTAGSLTILATALIETGSRMDDLIFQEFKGTGNMELVLDRKIAEQYIYPAVNIFKSGTRREELLLQAFQIEKIHFLRRGLAGHKPIEAIQRVISLLERYPNNAQMLLELSSKDK
jgi:transcription termination factor Rho